MSTLDAIQARHRKELKDLQSRITQKKKQATKKTRKGVHDECADLERALREKQSAELSALDSSATADIAAAAESDEDDPAVDVASEAASNEPPQEPEVQRPKRNRQKERLARRAAELEAEALKAEAEAAKLPDWKRRERSAMVRAFAEYGVEEKEIRPDGHCLYSSVADQVVQLGMGEGEEEGIEGYKAVRRRAARWIESHREDFEAFLEEPLGVYVHKIENTAEWGGHLELMALARSYNVEICVLQDGRLDKFGPGEDAGEVKKIWLAYYHHGYGLGEHYNSLRKSP
jgi:OTU domain-containing protein 6